MDSVSAPAGEQAELTDIERFVVFFQGLKTEDLRWLDHVYAPDAHIVDPFGDYHGLRAARRIFEAVLTQIRDYQLVVHEYAMTEAGAGFVRWTMSGFVRRLGRRRWTVEGVSMVRFDERGLVKEQIDYWDTGGQMYQRLPVLGWVIRRIRALLARH